MPPDSSGPTAGEQARLAGLMDILLALASGEQPPRAEVLGDGSLLDGIATGLNMMSEELAERRAREAELHRQMMQSERLAAVGQLAAGVAHEVNNPAAFILSNLEHGQLTLERLGDAVDELQGLPEATRVRITGLLGELGVLHEENLDGVRRISGIARTLLGFVRLQPERVGPVKLDEVARQAATVVGPELRRRAEFILSLEPVPPVSGDADRLVQVVTNLLLNAVQALPEAPGQQIELGTRTRGEQVILLVRDTGPGIPEEVQGRIFEPFFTTKPRGVGTGLGLPISAEIARTHGGTLAFHTVRGQGTTFELRLPAGTWLTVAPSPARELPTEPEAGRHRPRVLLVDDEAPLRRAYQRVLEGHFDVEAVESAEAAMALLQADGQWDAVLCDLVMPGAGGVGLFRFLEEQHPALLARTVFCTGGAFTATSRPLAERLGDRLLHKPVDPRALRAAIRRASGTPDG